MSNSARSCGFIMELEKYDTFCIGEDIVL